MAVAESTTTIRVSRKTRDRLKDVADARGIAITELVSALAHEAWRDYAFASEREASRRDALNPEVMAEQELWDETLGDGID
jgi:hypothetical protein